MPITKQTIAVIGATNNMGSAIAKSITGANYRILLFDQNPHKLQTLKEEIAADHPDEDLETQDCAHSCSWQADIIVMAVPHHAQKEIAENISDVATQKIVISISNTVNDSDTSAAEELQQWLPHSKVVKAFSTIPAANFEQPIINGKQTDAFIAGDHEDALAMVTELVETAGFNPVIAGGLSASSILERMQTQNDGDQSAEYKF